ncbi:hypothetical protein EVA_15227 [gut metagenome]|uniref:Uncharacterized protein n=1 Tax=gut metagenome TaxID=749906 RepID=J9G4B1_9ZZZZ
MVAYFYANPSFVTESDSAVGRNNEKATIKVFHKVQ